MAHKLILSQAEDELKKAQATYDRLAGKEIAEVL